MGACVLVMLSIAGSIRGAFLALVVHRSCDSIRGPCPQGARGGTALVTHMQLVLLCDFE